MGELSACALDDPSIDIHIDHGVCKLLAQGHPADSDKRLVIEGRQPAVMLRYPHVYHSHNSHNPATHLTIHLSPITPQAPGHTLSKECSLLITLIALWPE